MYTRLDEKERIDRESARRKVGLEVSSTTASGKHLVILVVVMVLFSGIVYAVFG